MRSIPRPRLFIAILLAIVLAISFSVAALAAPPSGAVPGQYIVVFRDDVSNVPEGLAETKAALLWQPSDGFANVPPVPEPSLDPRCALTG